MSEATALRLSEAQFQRQVIEYAQLAGWLCYHTHRSDKSAKGFPDLTMVRGRRVVFAELKSEHGRPTVEQRQWLKALLQAGCEVHLWRPADWDQIEGLLRRQVGR